MYEIVLFVHLLTIGAAFLAMGMMLFALLQLRGAQTVADALRAALSAGSVEKIMPVATLLLFASGAYMTHDRWKWTTPWIDVSIAGLLIVTVIGAGALGSRQRALHAALEAAHGTAINAALAARIGDPFLLAASGCNIGLVAGVMYVMVTKPPLVAGIAALLMGAAIGAFALGRLRIAAPAAAGARSSNA
jgi:hypothetical protein